MFKIGLTGNICAGKTEVEKILAQLNYKIVDLDIVSHNLLENNEKIRHQIFEEFKTLNRKEIAKIVFSDANKKQILENIIHPELKKYILNLFQENYKIIFVSGALLYETKFNEFFDKIIYIDAPYEIRLNRLMKRNDLNMEDAKLRLNSQNNQFKNKADYIIENDENIDLLKIKVMKIISLINKYIQ